MPRSAPTPTFRSSRWQSKWQFRDDLSKTIGKHTLKGGVDFIDNPSEGGFFEFSSTLEIDFAADPSVILGNTKLYPKNSPLPARSPAWRRPTAIHTFW